LHKKLLKEKRELNENNPIPFFINIFTFIHLFALTLTFSRNLVNSQMNFSIYETH